MGYKRKIGLFPDCPYIPARACCKGCDCRKRCFFRFLSASSVRRFRAEHRMRRYKRGQAVFAEGDRPQGLFVLCVGDVKVFKVDDYGRELTLTYHSCGDLMGEAQYLSGIPYGASAEAMRDSVICFLPRELVERLRRAEPELDHRLLLLLSQSMCRAMDRVFGFAFHSAESRVARFLLRQPTAVRCAAQHEPSAEPLSRREVASNLGLSPETVIRTFSSLRRRGLIAIQGKVVKVTDGAGLARAAEPS